MFISSLPISLTFIPCLLNPLAMFIRKVLMKPMFGSIFELTTLKPLTMWITVEQWNILNEMGILDHMVCLLRNLSAGQEQQLELDREQWTGSKL